MYGRHNIPDEVSTVRCGASNTDNRVNQQWSEVQLCKEVQCGFHVKGTSYLDHVTSTRTITSSGNVNGKPTKGSFDIVETWILLTQTT